MPTTSPLSISHDNQNNDPISLKENFQTLSNEIDVSEQSMNSLVEHQYGISTLSINWNEDIAAIISNIEHKISTNSTIFIDARDVYHISVSKFQSIFTNLQVRPHLC